MIQIMDYRLKKDLDLGLPMDSKIIQITDYLSKNAPDYGSQTKK